MRIRFELSTVACLLTLFLASLWIAYFDTFQSFQAYDDEGCMMLSVKYFNEIPQFYDRVQMPYGPGYYLGTWILHSVLQVPLTHNVNRFFTVAYWILTPSLLALGVFRITRSWLVGATLFLVAFAYMDQYIYEPGHPQGLYTALFSLAIAVASFGGSQQSRNIAIAGAIAATLFLIKVNVGAFGALALGLVLLPTGVSPAVRLFRVVSWGLALALPFLLMRSQLSETWVLRLILTSTCSLASLAVVDRVNSNPSRSPLGFALYLGAFATTFALLVAGALALGSSPKGMWDALLTGPIRLSKSMSIPSDVRRWAPLVAAGSLAITLLLTPRLLKGIDNRRISILLTMLRLGYGCIIVVFCLSRHRSYLQSYGPAFAWLILVPNGTPGTSNDAASARRTLAFLAVLESLLIYPIGGTQLTWGTFLYIGVGFLCLFDAISPWVSESLGEAAWLAPMRRVALPLVTIGALACLTPWARAVRWGYYDNPPLNLPGASLLRINEWEAARARWAVVNLKRQADTFQSYSAFNSLLLWTGLEPPVPLMIGNTIDSGPDPRQDLIVDAMERAPRGCFLRRSMFVPNQVWNDASPLLIYIVRDFHSSGTVGGEDLMVKKDRPLPQLVNCVSLTLSDKAGEAKVAMQLVGDSSRVIDRVAIYNVTKKRLIADSRTSLPDVRLRLTGAENEAPWRLDPNMPKLISGSFVSPHDIGVGDNLVVRLLDAEGGRVDTLPFFNEPQP